MATCQKEYDALQKAKEAWEKAKRTREEKESARDHRWVAGMIAVEAGAAISLFGLSEAMVASAAAASAAEAAGIIGAEFGAKKVVGSIIAIASSDMAYREAEQAYQDALQDEGVAYGNYLVAKRRYCECRRKNA